MEISVQLTDICMGSRRYHAA